jgi:uncharacterized protein YjdB
MNSFSLLTMRNTKKWHSDQPDVAAVYKGKITAISTGQAVITAKYGGKTATITVYVETARKLEADKTDIF